MAHPYANHLQYSKCDYRQPHPFEHHVLTCRRPRDPCPTTFGTTHCSRDLAFATYLDCKNLRGSWWRCTAEKDLVSIPRLARRLRRGATSCSMAEHWPKAGFV